MERRVLLAVFLSFVVLYAYQTIFVPPPPAEPGSPGASSNTAPQPGSAPQPSASAPETPAQPATPRKPLVGESAERDIVVDTATVRAVFTNRGARIKQWLLKDYQ